jgi:class 3 adenylate cyclase
LAKLYRAFISEMVAVLNSEDGVREVNIVGDCAWATYSTPYTTDIDDVFRGAFQANTLVRLLNVHLKARVCVPIKAGIGVDYGRVLMIKAGFKDSGINDVIYMGEVVNRAAHLAHEAGRGWQKPIWAGSVFRSNLNDHNQGLLARSSNGALGEVFVGDVVHTAMNDWIDENF